MDSVGISSLTFDNKIIGTGSNQSHTPSLFRFHRYSLFHGGDRIDRNSHYSVDRTGQVQTDHLPSSDSRYLVFIVLCLAGGPGNPEAHHATHLCRKRDQDGCSKSSAFHALLLLPHVHSND